MGQLDIFRDEAIRYALTLSRAGVPAELHLHPGVPHEYAGGTFAGARYCFSAPSGPAAGSGGSTR